ncbi:hypothetical protein BUH_1309 [Burkholderia pseudomallei Pakistan 9]|nr:hypothetical protein BUH_1309 [Burkholderia pseudomallei Pakistan 9]
MLSASPRGAAKGARRATDVRASADENHAEKDETRHFCVRWGIESSVTNVDASCASGIRLNSVRNVALSRRGR